MSRTNGPIRRQLRPYWPPPEVASRLPGTQDESECRGSAQRKGAIFGFSADRIVPPLLPARHKPSYPVPIADDSRAAGCWRGRSRCRAAARSPCRRHRVFEIDISGALATNNPPCHGITPVGNAIYRHNAARLVDAVAVAVLKHLDAARGYVPVATPAVGIALISATNNGWFRRKPSPPDRPRRAAGDEIDLKSWRNLKGFLFLRWCFSRRSGQARELTAAKPWGVETEQEPRSRNPTPRMRMDGRKIDIRKVPGAFCVNSLYYRRLGVRTKQKTSWVVHCAET